MHRQRLAGFARAPVAVGDDRDAIADLHDGDHAGHGARLGRVERAHFAADHRTLLERGVDHAGQFHIDAEFGRAVDLGRGVETLRWLADEREIFRILERHVGRRREFRGGSGEFAVGRALAGGAMHDAFCGVAVCRGDLPLIGRRCDEHHPRLGAGDAEFRPSFPHGRGAASDLGPEKIVGVGRRGLGVDDPDGREVDVELFGDQHRERGVDALAHLGARQHQRDGVVIADVHPSVRRVHRAGRERRTDGFG